MKSLALVLTVAAAPVFAASDAGKVVCEGVNPRVNKVTFSLEVNGRGTPTASAVYEDLSDQNAEPPWTAEFKREDMIEASIGFQHLTFIFGHHNTVWKVLADADIFGGASQTDNENDPYRGVLFLQSGNSKSSIHRFNVTCKKL